MRRITLRVQKFGDAWYVTGIGVPQRLRWQDRKREAVDVAVLVARLAEARGKLAQVVIHTADGRIQEERTYPRSSDPRRSRG